MPARRRWRAQRFDSSRSQAGRIGRQSRFRTRPTGVVDRQSRRVPDIARPRIVQPAAPAERQQRLARVVDVEHPGRRSSVASCPTCQSPSNSDCTPISFSRLTVSRQRKGWMNPPPSSWRHCSTNRSSSASSGASGSDTTRQQRAGAEAKFLEVALDRAICLNQIRSTSPPGAKPLQVRVAQSRPTADHARKPTVHRPGNAHPRSPPASPMKQTARAPAGPPAPTAPCARRTARRPEPTARTPPPRSARSACRIVGGRCAESQSLPAGLPSLTHCW